MIPNSFYARIFALVFPFRFCAFGVVVLGVKRLQHFGRTMSLPLDWLIYTLASMEIIK